LCSLCTAGRLAGEYRDGIAIAVEPCVRPRLPLVLLLVTTFAFAGTASARRRAVRQLDPRPIRHVFVLIMENGDADEVLARPFVKRLAEEGALLANYHGITHPSQPNYIALTAGSTWGVTDDATATLDVPHIGDLFDAAGLPWRVYVENYPGNCSLVHNADNGLYVRRHVPFLGYVNVQSNRERCNRSVVDATRLDADIAAGSLPAFAFYVPNQQHNGHDTDGDTADAWMESRFGPLLRDHRFTDDTLFVLTYDESERTSLTRVATVFHGAGVIPGAQTTLRYDHYDLLRTIEDLFHLGTLGKNDASEGELIREVFNVTQ